MNKNLLRLFGGVAVLAGLVGTPFVMHYYEPREANNTNVYTCTATIPATQAGEKTEVVFTGRAGGDGYSMNTTGLRPSQSVEIDGSMNPYGDTTRFDPNQYHNIDSSLGGKPTITDLRNATLKVVEGDQYTHANILIICEAPEHG